LARCATFYFSAVGGALPGESAIANRAQVGNLPHVRNRSPPPWMLYCIQMSTTTETLSIRLDAKTKKRLEALAIRSKRSKSFLAAEAVAAYVDAEEWQLGEIEAGVKELDRGETVNHEKVSKWLRSWGKASAGKTPR